jgi:hypothetical protein
VAFLLPDSVDTKLLKPEEFSFTSAERKAAGKNLKKGKRVGIT